MMITTATALLLVAPPSTIQQVPKTASTKQATPRPAGELAGTAKTDNKKQRLALAERVAKAHRGTDRSPILRYRADLTLRAKTKEAKGTVDVDLQVTYGKKIQFGTPKKPRSAEMVRFRVKEGDKPLERGKDPRPWMKKGGEPLDRLGDRFSKVGREELDKHTRLCKQMLAFLDPGIILKNLQGDTAVQQTTLKLGSRAKDTLKVELIRGYLPKFPVQGKDGEVEQRRVHMDAWIDKATSRLAAVRVQPLLPTGKPVVDRGQFIVLKDYVESKGTQLPRLIKFYAEMRGKRTSVYDVRLRRFELNPKLTKSDFTPK